MSDALTLAEARKQYNRAVEGPSQEKEEAAFVVLLAAHLRALAGTPEAETLERAAMAAYEFDTLNLAWADTFESTKAQWRGIVEAAYPILTAPFRAEVERLRERERYFAGLLGVADGGRYRADWDVHLTGLLDRLATAEARVKELEKQNRLLKWNNRAMEAELSGEEAP